MNLSRAAAILVTILIMHSQSQAATNDFQMQSILLPALHGGARFVDIDKHGRADLIVLEPLENRLAIYRQSASGFPTNPSQTLTLPPLTAWVAAFDADPAPGMELLASAPAGIFYFRHSDDGFEAEPRLLIKAAQVLTNVDAPLYMSLPTNATLPTISAGEAVVYANTNGLGWRAGEPLPLRAQAATLYTDRNQWTVGPNSARRLQIQESFTAESAKTDTNAFENAAIKKLAADLNKSPAQHLQGTSRVDVNGDGRKDLVLWEFFPGLEPKTDVYIFLRGDSGRLPERPSQLLHCRGMPVPAGSTQQPMPLVDLKRDGTFELVLVDLATTLTSASSIVDMVLSGGLECALGIRVFNRGGFSPSPNLTIPIRTIMPVTTLAPAQDMMDWPFFIHGDFNGDGRPDLVVRRSMNQWSILFSTKDERWFAPAPAMSFQTPVPGTLEIRDLNGDGLSDIVLRPENDPHMFVFLNQMQQKARQR